MTVDSTIAQFENTQNYKKIPAMYNLCTSVGFKPKGLSMFAQVKVSFHLIYYKIHCGAQQNLEQNLCINCNSKAIETSLTHVNSWISFHLHLGHQSGDDQIKSRVKSAPGKEWNSSGFLR